MRAPLLGALLASAALAQAPRAPARPAVAAAPEEPVEPGDEPRPVVTAVELHVPTGLRVPPDVKLDVRAGHPVSLREVRRSMLRLYATNLFASAEVRLVPAPGGVRVVFELAARQRIKDVVVEGNRAFPASMLLKASGLAPKAELTDDVQLRALDRVEELYRQRGYDQVTASMEQLSEGLQTSLLLQVIEGEPTRVQQVSVAGDPGSLSLEHILSTASLSVGGVLDRAALAEGLEKLRAELRGSRYYRASVGEPIVGLAAPWATVSLPISSGPRYLTHFHQNHHVPGTVLKAVLDYDATAEALDTPLAARLSRRLEAYYQSRGWFEARVRPTEVLTADGKEALLTFDIAEGPRLRVTSLSFTGNAYLGTRELLEQVRAAVQRREPVLSGTRTFDSLQIEGRSQRPGASEPPPLDPETVYSEDAYREAGDAITELYRNRGFLSARAQLAEATIDQERRTAKVRFEVEEGPRTRVASIGVEGLPVGVEVPVSAQPLQKGDPLSIALLERGRKELLQRLARQGYLYGRVDPDTRISGDGSEMDVVYRVDPGTQVRVGQISLEGAEKSDRQVVLANVPLKPGDIINPERLVDSQRALINLGAYRQVAVRLDQPELAESQKDLKVTLVERPTTEGEVGVGFSAVDGPRILLDGSYPNILGQAVNLDARGKIHWIGAGQTISSGFGLHSDDPRDFTQASAWYGMGGKAQLSLRAPRVLQLLPYSIGAHVDLVGEREFHPSFQYVTLAGIAGLDWQATHFLTASVQYNLELDRVCTYQLRGQTFDCGSGGLADLLTDQERRFFQFGSFLLQSVGPSITLDLRDDPANPKSGVVASATAELTSSLLSRYPLLGMKAQGYVTGYLPLARRVVLAGSLRAGRFIPLLPSQPLPAPKRFYLGGFSTLRGFREDGVLPQDRRDALRHDRQSCAALVNHAGCTRAALALLGGSQIPSEGGEMYTLGKLELRLPFLGAMDVGLFFEAGNLWSDTTTFRAFELRPVAGGGIRYETPIGPLALDVGFNLLPDALVNEQTFNFHFNIGLF